MSLKRKFEEAKHCNPHEMNQNFLDFEQKFKMVKKTPIAGRKGTNKQIESSAQIAIPSSEISQTPTNKLNMKMEVEGTNNIEKGSPEPKESIQKTNVKRMNVKKENDIKESQKHKTKNTEVEKGLTFCEWMRNGGKINEIKEVAEKEAQAKARMKGKVPSTKFNRNRGEIEHLLDDYEYIDRHIELGDGKIEQNEIIISSWNINGLKRLLRTGDLQKYVKESDLDIICLNETKLADVEFDEAITSWIPEGYTGIFNCCKIKNGYSGTAIITKFKPIYVKFDIGVKKHDLEGRTITAEFEKFYLVTSYFPNSGGELVGLRYRVDQWDPDFRNYVGELRKKKHVVVCGDFNCCHTEYDIYDLKKYAANHPDHSPEEAKNFSDLLDSGFVDTFRSLHPKTKEYSYYSTGKAGVRFDTKGWRLDYFLVDKDGVRAVRDSMINNNVAGSNHLPVEIIIDPQFKKCQKSS